MDRTILIVEDSDDGRDTLELALARLSGVHVRAASTAEEALERLKTDDVCAIITDLHLPAMDGFELIEAVRSRLHRSSLPILVISGDSDPGTPARVAGLGANAYFPKPYSPEEIRSTLEQLLHAS